jgi:tRNA(adenine34) deaminase
LQILFEKQPKKIRRISYFLKGYRQSMTDHADFMQQAIAEAGKALADGEFPVGCVMVHRGRVVSKGRRINSRAPDENELDHAEIVALRELFAKHPEIDRAKIIVYSSMEPCLMCYVTLLLNGFRNFVYAYEDIMGGGTSLDLQSLNPLYRDMEADVTGHVLRRQSLELFKAFFADQDNTYWQDSPLALYTLAQIADEETE